MDNDELKAAIDLVVTGVTDQDRPRYVASLVDQISGVVAPGRFSVLDPNVGRPGGAAFLWEDVLSLADIWDASESLRMGFNPSEIAQVVVALLGLVQRIRKVRVPLSANEFKVLLSVKRGAKSIEQIISRTGMQREEVLEVSGALMSRTYQDKFQLLDRTADEFSTRL